MKISKQDFIIFFSVIATLFVSVSFQNGKDSNNFSSSNSRSISSIVEDTAQKHDQ